MTSAAGLAHQMAASEVWIPDHNQRRLEEVVGSDAALVGSLICTSTSYKYSVFWEADLGPAWPTCTLLPMPRLRRRHRRAAQAHMRVPDPMARAARQRDADHFTGEASRNTP